MTSNPHDEEPIKPGDVFMTNQRVSLNGELVPKRALVLVLSTGGYVVAGVGFLRFTNALIHGHVTKATSYADYPTWWDKLEES